MSVDQSTGPSTGTVQTPAHRPGGSHRAARRGPGPLVLVGLGVVLVVAAVLAAFLLLGGSEESQPTDQAQDEQAQAEQPQTGQGQDDQPQGDAPAGGEAQLASAPSSVGPGEALAANDRLELDADERADLQQGRVDLRVLTLLALLTADYDIGVADFAAPDSGDGERTAYVVDIDSVDGRPVQAAPGRDLARVAADQNGVYLPQDVSTVDGVIRITYAPADVGDLDDLPPVPLP